MGSLGKAIFGIGSPPPPPPPLPPAPAPTPDASLEDAEAAELARKRRSIEKGRVGRAALVIEPDRPNSGGTGLRINNS